MDMRNSSVMVKEELKTFEVASQPIPPDRNARSLRFHSALVREERMINYTLLSILNVLIRIKQLFCLIDVP